MEHDERQQALRQRVLCGRCKAGKLMIWETSDGRMSDKPNGGASHDGLFYLVRCDYFRLTVQSPDALITCDGFQLIKPKSS